MGLFGNDADEEKLGKMFDAGWNYLKQHKVAVIIVLSLSALFYLVAVGTP